MRILQGSMTLLTCVFWSRWYLCYDDDMHYGDSFGELYVWGKDAIGALTRGLAHRIALRTGGPSIVQY